MLIPSIDIAGGQVVQWIGGRDEALTAGDPREWMERFGTVGTVAVVDLDAALGRGDNTALIEPLLRMGRVRVGGGIRSVESALRWLDLGAEAVVIGTAAKPEILRELPRDRVVAALDAQDGEVVTHGWRTRSGATIADRMAELKDLVSGFLVTFVEREGRLGGTDLERAATLAQLSGDARLTIAGGVTTAEEIAALDRLGADAQVGMALYTGRLSLVDAFAAPLRSDRPDGLWSTVVVDERGRTLGLAWSNRESLAVALERRRGVYHSRRRGLWIKGETSGDTQELLAVDVDCDRDCLRFTVRQVGGFCHTGTWTCFGERRGLGALEARLAERAVTAPPGSYTARLLADPATLRGKLLEEAEELAEATDRADVVHEAADLFYFAMVAMQRAGVTVADVEAELDQRALRVRRRTPSAPKGAGGA
jgi:phosphoribosyl-ATP pyrophosphohydrolase